MCPFSLSLRFECDTNEITISKYQLASPAPPDKNGGTKISNKISSKSNKNSIFESKEKKKISKNQSEPFDGL